MTLQTAKRRVLEALASPFSDWPLLPSNDFEPYAYCRIVYPMFIHEALVFLDKGFQPQYWRHIIYTSPRRSEEYKRCDDLEAFACFINSDGWETTQWYLSEGPAQITNWIKETLR